MGGFVAPFVKELGYPVPDFDFAVPGVWSISADLHKYGMTPRNASLLLFREAALREHAQFYFDDWPYGSYGTVTIGGSRTGGSLAAAWAVMRNLGQDGYLAVAKTIMETRQRFMDGISEIDGLHVIGEPHTALICFGSDAFDIYAVADAMRDLGWALGRGKDPASIHLSVAPIHVPAVDEFLAHLRTAVADVRCGRIVSEGRGAVYV